MSLRLTRDLLNSAEVVQGSGQIKNTLQITVNTDGTVSDSLGGVLDILPLGNRGDHCVTKLEFTLPEALQEGYDCFIVADLREGLYVQHCSMDQLKAVAWITTNISFSTTSLINLLFVCVESEALQTGNLDGEIEIFVTDEFSGQIKSNFLTSGWHTGTVDDEYIMTGDSVVSDLHVPATPNPTSYTPMTWVNGESELNAANMNNIMLGIEEAMKTPDNVMTSDGDDWNITGGKTFKGEVYFDENSTTKIYNTPSDSADIVSKGYVDGKFIDYVNTLFTPSSEITVLMQHCYQIGNLIFVHISFNWASSHAAGVYTIGSLSKHALHRHIFAAAAMNSASGSITDAGSLETNGSMSVHTTATGGGTGYTWDISFFFSEGN